MQGDEMIRNVAPEQAADRFPMIVKKGSAVVKVYEVKNRDRKNYTVSYLTAVNGRVRKTFADLDTAKREADAIALNLAHGDLQGLKLTGATGRFTWKRNGRLLGQVSRSIRQRASLRVPSIFWDTRALSRRAATSKSTSRLACRT
jgi:hypothetical protein